MLWEHKATPTEGKARVDLAIDASGTLVRFTQSGPDLFAQTGTSSARPAYVMRQPRPPAQAAA
jgi:hypothetical protein